MSRFIIVATGLAIALVAMGAGAPPSPYLSEKGPVIGPHASQLDSLIPGASGICLVEVTKLREEDTRATDGDLAQIVELKPIRGTGITTGGFALGRASSGFTFRDDRADSLRAAQIRFLLRPDVMRLGHRYWIATASLSDPRYPQGLAGVWAEDSTTFAPLFESAIQEDAYAWRPYLWRPGWTVGWLDHPGDVPTRARVWRHGRLILDMDLEGRRTGNTFGAAEARLIGEQRPPGSADTALYFIADLICPLPAKNRFDLPPGRAVIRDILDLWSGRMVASEGAADSARDVRCYESFDRHGRRVYERVTEYVRAGGISVGAGREDWLRRVERWFDAGGHRVVREDVRRYGELPYGSSGRIAAWIPVDRDSAFRTAPLKRAYLLAGR